MENENGNNQTGGHDQHLSQLLVEIKSTRLVDHNVEGGEKEIIIKNLKKTSEVQPRPVKML